MPGASKVPTADLVSCMEPVAPSTRRTGRALQPGAPRSGGWRTSAQQTQNQPSDGLPDRRKRIVVCADGTWNTPRERDSSGPTPTNVWLFYQLIPILASDDLPQLAFYHAGVGTGGFVDRVVGGAFGVGLKGNILECYRFLVEH